MAREVKFVLVHNPAACLSDPPKTHREFKSMVAGLKSCKIAYALSANSTICKNLIADFWLNASHHMASANAPERILSKIQGRDICVSEQVIRDVLQIRDSPSSPTAVSYKEVVKILKKMGYEGTSPPTVKRLLPPYWRFLFHTFILCFSGKKGGFDEISAASSTAITALTMDWDFNFSRFVLNEMRSNLSKKKEVFAMYPRFVQLILDAKYPELTRSGDSLDIKIMGPSTFGLMKQSKESAKDVFKGTEPLIKFGKFCEIEDVAPPVTAMVAEEHVVPPVTISLDSDVVESESAEQTHVPSDEEIQAIIAKLQDTARKPPPACSATSEPLSETDPEPAPLIRKRKRNDPRLRAIISETSQAPIQTTAVSVSTTQAEPSSTAQVSSEPSIDISVSAEETVIPGGSSHASGSSSGQGPSSQDPSLGDPRYEASIRLAQLLESEDAVPPSRRTGIHIGKEKQSFKDSDQTIAGLQSQISTLQEEALERDLLIGQLDIQVSDLKKDNEEKGKLISSLQVNLGGLTAIVFDLKSKLSAKFGSDFQPFAPEATPSTKTDPVSTTPAPDTVIDEYLSSGPRTAEESRAKQKRIAEKKKGKSLLMKSTDHNQPLEDQVYISELEKKKFGDKYGDRSGILVWGFDRDRDLFYVKRKSNRLEYYEKMTDFFSWTPVDLSELAHAPFYNPSNVRKAWLFKTYLEDRSAKSFKGMKTASSFIRKARGVLDPHTNKRMTNVMWPPTKKLQKVPMSKRFPDGILTDMQFWAYDQETSTAVVKLKNDNELRFIDPKDLIRFGEQDIKCLMSSQILVTDDMYETCAKEWTGMVARIIEKKLWAGALAGRSDVAIVDL